MKQKLASLPYVQKLSAATSCGTYASSTSESGSVVQPLSTVAEVNALAAENARALPDNDARAAVAASNVDLGSKGSGDLWRDAFEDSSGKETELVGDPESALEAAVGEPPSNLCEDEERPVCC